MVLAASECVVVRGIAPITESLTGKEKTQHSRVGGKAQDGNLFLLRLETI